MSAFNPEGTPLVRGRMCKDYPDIPQTSMECQNCRYNHFISGNIAKQVCRPHTFEEALKKGRPGSVPSHFPLIKNNPQVE